MACLVDITDLSVEDIDKIIALAEDIRNNPVKYVESCKHKILATLFYEPSTRTRLSFESAMISLGGSVIGFSGAGASSATKGETIADICRIRIRRRYRNAPQFGRRSLCRSSKKQGSVYKCR
mgnify:CR=1 FL=1